MENVINRVNKLILMGYKVIINLKEDKSKSYNKLKLKLLYNIIIKYIKTIN